jgi:hypothetical protein
MAVLSLGVSAKLVVRFGARLPLVTGLLLAAVGLALFARAPVDGDFAVDVLPSMILLGAGAARDWRSTRCCSSRERCRGERGRARVGRRQRVVQAGRSARPRGPREPRRRCRVRRRRSGAERRAPARTGRRGSAGGGRRDSVSVGVRPRKARENVVPPGRGWGAAAGCRRPRVAVSPVRAGDRRDGPGTPPR